MRVQTRLREIRTARGISAVDLARASGVTRQTIYAIEDGSFVPNTAVSLQLARTLGVSVETIFSIESEAASTPAVKAELLIPPGSQDSGLLRLCPVQDRLTAVPVSVTPAYLPAADSVVVSRVRRTALVNSFGSLPEPGRRLLLAGCDPALSLLADTLALSGFEIVSVPCSSRRALQWLKQGRIHAAGTHLRDRKTGQYNVPIVRTLFQNEPVRMVTFAAWEQGLIVPPANPKSIASIADLANKRVTFVNREKGSGSRDLLDTALEQLGIHPEEIKGYESIADGHLTAAETVAAGIADCCIGPRSAARCYGLGFISLQIQRFDLALHGASLDLPVAKAMMDALNRSALRKRLEGVAGYDASHTGDVLM